MAVEVEKINIAKEIYSKLPKWNIANNLLTKFFKNKSSNYSREDILIKILLIDSLYKTNLKDPISLAEHISSLNYLPEEIKSGDSLAVDKVANFNGKNLLSFSSKFCHFHNKECYPIYDKYVCVALKNLIGWKDKRTYKNFLEGTDKLREYNHIQDVSFEDLDKYLWLYGILLNLRSGKKDINLEVKTFYYANPNKFERLI